MEFVLILLFVGTIIWYESIFRVYQYVGFVSKYYVGIKTLKKVK